MFLRGEGEDLSFTKTKILLVQYIIIGIQYIKPYR